MLELRIHGEHANLDLEALMGRRRELRDLHGTLTDRYQRANPRGGRAAAEREAMAGLERLVRAAVADLGTRFAAEKGSILEQILTTRRDVHDLYAAVLGEGGKPVKVEDIRQQFEKLRKLLRDVRERPEDMAARQGPHPELDAEQRRIARETAPTPASARAKVPVDASAERLTKKRFAWVEKVKAWVKRFRGGGRVEFTIEDGLYKVRSFAPGSTTPEVFSEFDTLERSYREKPLSSRVMQAHHGLQDALMDFLLRRYGYDGAEAPTIWLRDSTGESPHGRITHEMQNPNQAERMRDPDLSYARIRELGVADLKRAGAPSGKIEAYLRAMDAHFRDRILPRIDAAVRGGKISPAEARALVGGSLFQ